MARDRQQGSVTEVHREVTDVGQRDGADVRGLQPLWVVMRRN